MISNNDFSVRLASVETIETDGVTLKFEGENKSSNKSYKVMNYYNPSVNDRVLIVEISGTSVVLGSYGAPVAPVEYIPITEKGEAGGVATLNSGGQVEQRAVSAASADHATSADSATSASSASTATNFTGRHTGSTLSFFGATARNQQSVPTLSTSADLAATIARVNVIITAGRNYGLYGA